MAKKMNPLLGIVGGLLAIIFLFSIVSIVFYPADPVYDDDHGHGHGPSPDAPHDDDDHTNGAHDNGDDSDVDNGADDGESGKPDK